MSTQAQKWDKNVHNLTRMYKSDKYVKQWDKKVHNNVHNLTTCIKSDKNV